MPPFGSLLEPPTNFGGGQGSSFYVKQEPGEGRKAIGMDTHRSVLQPQQSAFSSYNPSPSLRKAGHQHEPSAFGPFSGGGGASCDVAVPLSWRPPPPAQLHQYLQPSSFSAKGTNVALSSDVGSSGLVTTGIRDTTSDGFVAVQSVKCKQECDIASTSFSAPPLTRKRSHSELAEEESCDSELVLGIGSGSRIISSREGSEYRNSRASSPRKSQKCGVEFVSADLCLAPPVEYSSSSAPSEHASPTESHLSFQKVPSRMEGVVVESGSRVRPLLNLEVIKRECDAVEREDRDESHIIQSSRNNHELGLFPGVFATVDLQRQGKKSEASGLQLVHLLLACADAISKNKIEVAAQKLEELYSHASLFGDSMQRIAAFFTEGLAARIVGKENPMYKNLMLQSRLDDYLSAFTTLYKVCPFFQFGHFTANQAILEAVADQPVVHIIDLDLMQGFQWPGLIQSLSERDEGPPKLKITGIGTNCTSLQDTGRRLAAFAETYGVPFEFHAVVGELEDLTLGELGVVSGEAVAVNCVMQLHRLGHEKLNQFTSGLRTLGPVMVTLVEQEANHNTSTFMGRFVEALHYYAAVFDSLDSSLPLASEERAKIEQLYFAQQIKNIVACEGSDRIERHETLDIWQQRMELAGFRQLPLSSHAVTQAKLLLSLSPCDGYRLSQQPGGSISLNWQDRSLLTASTWVVL